MSILGTSRKLLVSGVAAATIASSALAFAVAPVSTMAATPGCTSGSLIKGSFDSLYYCGADGKRYVFPNEKTYKTWYANFDNVVTLSNTQLGSIMIGGNVTYRPGVKMVKIDTDPKTYAVDHNGTLHWITSEAIATCLYGSDWNKKIDDVSDAFFVNYAVGSTLANCQDFNIVNVMGSSVTINQDKNLSAPVDTTAPTVSSVMPASMATTIARDTTVSATFSESMDASTLTNATFTLTGPNNAAVTGTVAYSGLTATFTPSAQLMANSMYTATLTTSVKDTNGNPLSGAYSWTFTTTP